MPELSNASNTIKENALPTVGFAGLTHLGINSAVAAAVRGFRVYGFHDDQVLIKNLKNGILSISEPDLDTNFNNFIHAFEFGHQPEILFDCDIVYLSIDVPTDSVGNSELSPINNMLKSILSVLKPEAMLVVLCQVNPGFTREVNWPSNQVYYQVETLIFGQALNRALNPERIIIGCADPQIPIEDQFLKFLHAFNCPILPMQYESAEMAKISINMFLIASVTATNTLAELCEKIGADWYEIIPALQMDRRIGKFAYLKPGLGISGGNLERDLKTVINLAHLHNTESNVLESYRINSENRKDWAGNILEEIAIKSTGELQIAVLGLAYKQNTNSTKNSPSLIFLERLVGYKVKAFDPEAPTGVTPPFVLRVSNENEAIRNADILAIMTPWPQFGQLDIDQILDLMKGNIILDPFRVLRLDDRLKSRIRYFCLGSKN